MSSNSKNSTVTIKVTCAIVFLIFVFCYVFFYQTDILALSQHIWSGGETKYIPIVGVTLITLVLYIVHLGVAAMVKLPAHVLSLTYAPSLILLGGVTSAKLHADGTMSVGGCAIGACLLLIVVGILMRVLSDLTSMDKLPKNASSLFSEISSTNLGILAILMFTTFALGNNNRQLHSYLKMERLVMEKQYNASLDVDKTETDSSMTFLRSYALSKCGELGEHLFEYPLVGGSRVLLPTRDKTVRLLIMPDSLVWHHVGAAPCEEIKSVTNFCRILQKQHLAHPCVDDYMLTALLLDKNLLGFAREITKYYDFRTEEQKKAAQDKLDLKRKKLARIIGKDAARDSVKEVVLLTPSGYPVKSLDELPKHYREALILYTHIHSQRVLTYTNAAMDADYEDYLKLERTKYKTSAEHDAALKDGYFGTYWWYYAKGGKNL